MTFRKITTFRNFALIVACILYTAVLPPWPTSCPAAVIKGNFSDIVTKGPWVDVRAYGADTTGIQDSTAAIVLAEATGAPVYFPKGIYKITSGITSNSPNEWFGNGEGSVIRASSALFDMLTIGPGASGKKIRNIKFLGAAANNSTTQFAVFTSSSPDRVEVSGCYFDNTNNGIKNVDGKYWNVHHNTFERLVGAVSGTGYGYLSGGSSYYNNIESNLFIGSSGKGRHAVYFSAGGSYNTAKNNIVVAFNESAFVIYATNVQDNAIGNVIDSNKIYGGGNSGTAESGGIGITCNAQSNKITNNGIFNFQNAGIVVNDFGCGGLVNSNKIIGNSIDNAYYQGIQLIGTKNTTVSGNQIYNASAGDLNTYPGIGLFGNGTGGAQVNDNAIVIGNVSMGYKQRVPFQINAAAPVSTGTKISGNTFISAAWAPGLAYEILGNAVVKMDGNITDQSTANGTPATDAISLHLSKINSIDFPNILANTSSDQTITLTGVDNTWSVIATPQGSPETGIVTTTWASADNTITIRASNVTTGAINPAARTYRFDAWKH